MELKESNDHRCYMTPYNIPTIQLGDGGVIISDLSFKDNEFSGIGFSLGQGEVGESHTPEEKTMAEDFGVFLQIISTSPESIQVMIDQLIKAKANLEA